VHTRLAVTDIHWTTSAPGLLVTVSFGAAYGPAKDCQMALCAAGGRLLAASRISLAIVGLM
jgi:hypothetical protein